MLHEAWHVAVLLTVLWGAVSAVLLAVDRLIPGLRPPALGRARPWLWGIAASATLLVLYEWTTVH